MAIPRRHDELTLTAYRPADTHPAAVYLAKLSPGSRRAMRAALDTIAGILTSGRCNAEALDWAALRYQHRLAVDEGRFRLAWRRALDRHFPRYLSGEISLAEQRRARVRDVFYRPTMSDWETDGIIEEFLTAYEASWRLFPEVRQVLDALRGITLGVLTNGNAHQQMRKLQHTGIIERCKVVVVSERVGHAKPAPEIFQAACSQLGCRATACVFVSDDGHRDVEGARRSGMAPVWLRRGGISAGCEAEGLPMIDNLVELLEKDEVRRLRGPANEVRCAVAGAKA